MASKGVNRLQPDRISLPELYLPCGAKVPVALISLTAMPERRQKLIERKIPREWVSNFFPATDLRGGHQDIDIQLGDQVTLTRRYRNRMRPSDIGCAISHRKAAEALLETDDDLMLVLEDDVIPVGNDFLCVLTQIASVYLSLARSGAAFVCHLGPYSINIDGIRKRQVVSKIDLPTPQFLYVGSKGYVAGAFAYLISRGAARKLVEKSRFVQGLADDWLHFRSIGVLDKLFFCWPPVVLPDLLQNTSLTGAHVQNDLSVPSGKYRKLATVFKGDFCGRVIRRVEGNLRDVVEKGLSVYPFRLP